MSINWPASNLDNEAQAWRRKVEETLDQAARNSSIQGANLKALTQGAKSTRKAVANANLDLADQREQLEQAARIPAAPTGPNVTTDAYFDEYGYPRARVFGTVNPVETDINGAAIGIVRYELAGRKDEAGQSWAVVAEAPAVYEEAPQLEAQGLPAGEDWAFKVRAVSDTGVPGEYSAEITVRLAKDETAPPKPAAPTATSRLGQVIISWSGLTATGDEQPADFSHAEVGIALSSTSAGEIVGQIGRNGDTFVAPGIPYDEARWFYVVAVDFAGNRSAASDRTSVTTQPLVDTDIIGRVIDGANLKLDSIQGDVIAAGAIDEEKISNEVTQKIDDAVTDAANAIAGVTLVTDAGDQYISNPGFRVDQSTLTVAERWSRIAGGGRFMDIPGAQGLAFGISADAGSVIAEGGVWDTNLIEKGALYYLPPGETVQITASGVMGGGAEGLVDLELHETYSTLLATTQFEVDVASIATASMAYTNTKSSSVPLAVRINCAVTDGVSQVAIINKVSAYNITDVQFALDTANSKNKNYYQPGAPTGGTYQVGDTWFDTSDNNAIYRWDGTAWVPVLLGAEALAEQVTDAIDQAQNNAQQAVNDAGDALTKANIAVKSVSTQYAVGSSNSTPPTSGWSTAMPTHTPGSYIWMRQVTTRGDDSTVTSSPALVTGNDGADGAGIEIAGTVATYAALPSSLGAGDAGKAYLVSADGKLYIWDGSAWPADGDGVAFQGPPGTPGGPGSDGDPGVSVVSITPYYLLAGAGSGTPSKPTTNPPGTGWSVTEPGYQSSMELYRTELIVMSDSSFGYSNVSKVSAYTGSTQAITVANLAQASADGKVKASTTDPGHDPGRIWLVLNGSGDCIGIRISNGSAWSSYTLMADQVLVPSSVGATSIANGAITTPKIVAGAITAASGIIADAAIGTAKIADAAITNAKIANIDAGKITTGFLNAGRIETKSISSSKLLISNLNNLVENNSFETVSISDALSAAGWVARHSRVQRVAENPRTGTYAMRFDADTAPYAGLSAYTPLAVKGGERYRVGVWVRRATGTSAGPGIVLRFRYGPSEAAQNSHAPDAVASQAGTGTDYTYISGVWTVPPAAKFARLEIVMRDTTPDQAYFVDDIEVFKMTDGELIVDGAITADKIAANAITAAKIEAGAVTAAKIEAGAVTAAKIAANTITANEIAANAVTADELAANSVTAGKIAALSVTAGKIAANAITADKIEAGAVTTVKLDANAVTAAKIAANAITASKIHADAINGKTITGALVRSAASGARTELTNQGLRVMNSANQELVKLGYGIATGMEARNPHTGQMVPLANAAFGSASVSEAAVLNYPLTPNVTTAYTRHSADGLTLTFVAPSSRGVLSWGQVWLFSSGTFGTQSPVVYVNPVVNGTSLTTSVGSGGSNFPIFARDAPQGANPSLLEDWECNANSSVTVATTPGATYSIQLQFRFRTGAMSTTTTYLVNRFISFQPSFQ